jgi:hypothetical protein
MTFINTAPPHPMIPVLGTYVGENVGAAWPKVKRSLRSCSHAGGAHSAHSDPQGTLGRRAGTTGCAGAAADRAVAAETPRARRRSGLPGCAVNRGLTW